VPDNTASAAALAISLCVGVVLTLASKFASHEAMVLGLHGAKKAAFAQALYLAANCLTRH
jgi:hypothetical protein